MKYNTTNNNAMATVSLAESAAPRDFHISVSSSSARYTRCLLCAAGRRAFYCPECIASGNFVHSSIPYSERFADKQLKLYRLKANRKYVKERCESLLVGKNKHERLRLDNNQCKERVAILKLAIDQTRRNAEEKKLQLEALTRYNGELQVKLPRYQKRVASLEKHTLARREELRASAAECGERARDLAALRRARLRQLMNYIFVRQVKLPRYQKRVASLEKHTLARREELRGSAAECGERARDLAALRRARLRQLMNYIFVRQVKLPRYQKRVASLEKHTLARREELRGSAAECGERARDLAALRRARLRQLMNYIFVRQVKLPRYQKRVASLEKHTLARREELRGSAAECGERARDLAALRRARLRQLMNYIFVRQVKLPRYQKRVASLEKHTLARREELRGSAAECGERARDLAALRRARLRQLMNYIFVRQVKLPRYQKRVASLEKHTLARREELRGSAAECGERARDLAALRRARLRQLMNYIFPVHLSYDARESSEEEDDFLQDMRVVEPAERAGNVRLHIATAWLPANGDYSKYNQWVSAHKDEASGSGAAGPEGTEHPVYRISAGLSLAAQLTTLVASYLAVRLPYNLHFSDYCGHTLTEAGLGARVRRLLACVVWVCVHARRPPPPAARHALTLLHALHTAAATDDHHLGRVESWLSSEMLAAAEAWEGAGAGAGAGGCAADAELSDDEPEPPEHLHWDHSEELSVVSASPPAAPPAAAASLVTSAAASLASFWRGWTK